VNSYFIFVIIILIAGFSFILDIQEFYELTLLDDTKSVQQKTAETIRIANKWESDDGPIANIFNNNEVSVFINFGG